MNPVVLTCSSLREFLEHAQYNMKTAYPVVMIDREYHAEPNDMKIRLAEIIRDLPPEYDTVLVAMGFCGGAWDHVRFDRRIVIPRVDDCVSLLMSVDDEYIPNRKEAGHLYLYETDPDAFSAISLMRNGYQCRDLEGLDPKYLFSMLTQGYTHMDIVDTGLNPCYEVEYVEKAQAQADELHADLDFVPGGIHLLEKLVSGQWDEQFITAQPGEMLYHGKFFG